jgi:hypothetical protein
MKGVLEVILNGIDKRILKHVWRTIKVTTHALIIKLASSQVPIFLLIRGMGSWRHTCRQFNGIFRREIVSGTFHDECWSVEEKEV